MVFEKVVTRMETPKHGSTSYDFYTTETLVQKGKRSLKNQISGRLEPGSFASYRLSISSRPERASW